MMALSFSFHLFFFIFLLVGHPSWGSRPPALQGYQVNLVSPGPLGSVSVQGSPSRSRGGVGSDGTGGIAGPSRVQAPSPAPLPISAPRSPVSAKAPKMETEPDPERLQEWWKKAAGSIKVPAVQPKQPVSSPPTLLRESSRVDITKRQTKVPPADPSSPAVSSSPVVPSSQGFSSGGGFSGTGKGTGEIGPHGTGPQGGSQGGSQGSLTGGSGFQAGVIGGGGSMNGPISQFPGYLQIMENKISGQWAPPPISMQGEGVGAIIQFNVRKDGRIESVEIEKSSGNKFFDLAAMRAVSQAHPLPPLPEDLNEERLTVHFSFTVQKGS